MPDSTPADSPDAASLHELRARLRDLEGLIARVPIPIAIARDPDCRNISANAALAALLQVPPSVNVSLTPPPGEAPLYRIQRQGVDIPADQLPMQYAIAHRTSVRNEIEIVLKDGTVRYVQNDVEPLFDAHGLTPTLHGLRRHSPTNCTTRRSTPSPVADSESPPSSATRRPRSRWPIMASASHLRCCRAFSTCSCSSKGLAIALRVASVS